MAGKPPDTAISFYCAQSIAPALLALRQKTLSVQKRRNIDDIHDVRVASRRVRSCLAIFAQVFPAKKLKNWQRDIRKITQSFGKVRDLDVQIELLDQVCKEVQDQRYLAGLKRIRLRLKQKRQVEQAETRTVTRAILESTTLLELQEWVRVVLEQSQSMDNNHAALFQLGYEYIQKRLDEFLFFEVFIFDPQRVSELHQMRIAAKQLRYSLEIFSSLYQGKSDFALDVARQSQQILGEIHDADVWITFLPAILEKELGRVQKFYGYKRPFTRLKPGIEYLLENRRGERSHLYGQFIQEWRNWKLKETWLSLRKLIFLTNLEQHQSPQMDQQGQQPSNQPTNQSGKDNTQSNGGSQSKS